MGVELRYPFYVEWGKVSKRVAYGQRGDESERSRLEGGVTRKKRAAPQ